MIVKVGEVISIASGIFEAYDHYRSNSSLGAEPYYFFGLSAALAALEAKLSGGIMPSFTRAVAE